MSAMTQIPEHYVTMYESNWLALVQQQQSRIRNYVKLDTISGKEKRYSQIGKAVMNLITTRSGATSPTEVPLAQRWVRPRGYDTTALFDEFDTDLLGSVTQPTGETVQAQAMAYGRTCDQVLIDALTGTAYTGETGTTATDLPDTQKVDVDYVESGNAANSGLTIGKLRQAKYILDHNEVDDMDPRFVVVSAKQLQDLLQTTEVTSHDYNTVRALVNGQIDTFLGFKFIRTELLALSGTIRTVIAYAKSGAVLADAGRKVHMDVREDLRHSLQIRTVAQLGATRLEEEKVVAIACDEAPPES